MTVNATITYIKDFFCTGSNGFLWRFPSGSKCSFEMKMFSQDHYFALSEIKVNCSLQAEGDFLLLLFGIIVISGKQGSYDL